MKIKKWRTMKTTKKKTKDNECLTQLDGYINDLPDKCPHKEVIKICKTIIKTSFERIEVMEKLINIQAEKIDNQTKIINNQTELIDSQKEMIDMFKSIQST
jgi:hypothetical protein